MSYIGRQNLGGAYRQLDDISSGFDGSDTTHTMQVNSQNVTVGDVNQIILSLGGVIQKPGTDFTVSGSVLTFTTAPASGLSFMGLILGAGVDTATVGDQVITNAKISNSAGIAGSKIAPDFSAVNAVTTRFMVPPKITTTQRGNLTGLVSGAFIYNTSLNKLQVYNGSAWETVTSST